MRDETKIGGFYFILFIYLFIFTVTSDETFDRSIENHGTLNIGHSNTSHQAETMNVYNDAVTREYSAVWSVSKNSFTLANIIHIAGVRSTFQDFSCDLPSRTKLSSELLICEIFQRKNCLLFKNCSKTKSFNLFYQKCKNFSLRICRLVTLY